MTEQKEVTKKSNTLKATMVRVCQQTAQILTWWLVGRFCGVMDGCRQFSNKENRQAIGYDSKGVLGI